MPSMEHERQVFLQISNDLNLRTSQFPKAFVEFLLDTDNPEALTQLEQEDNETLRKLNRTESIRATISMLRHELAFRPDLYKFENFPPTKNPEHEGFHVTCIEVVKTHDVGAEKLRQYSNFWFYLDCLSSWLTLKVIHHQGALIATYQEEDWIRLYYQFLRHAPRSLRCANEEK